MDDVALAAPHPLALAGAQQLALAAARHERHERHDGQEAEAMEVVGGRGGEEGGGEEAMAPMDAGIQQEVVDTQIVRMKTARP